jgi:3,4-dihydroxy 2-butanone 4-phosphate synthase / GTP cyclohydrolase II
MNPAPSPTRTAGSSESIAVGALSPLREALDAIRAGQLIGIASMASHGACMLCMAAEVATAESINWMIIHGRGLICVALTGERCDELGLRAQGAGRTTGGGLTFVETIEARDGISTGISAADRARTIRVAADPRSTRHDLVRPGHVVPIRVPSDTVLDGSAASAAIDLVRLAGLIPAAAVCHVLDVDGDTIDYPRFVELCRAERIPIVTTSDVRDYHLRNDRIIARTLTRVVGTAAGEFVAVCYPETVSSAIHYALVHGDVRGPEPVPTRIHVQDPIDDVFGQGSSLMSALAETGRGRAGVLLYMAREVAIPPPWVDDADSMGPQTLGGGSLSGYAAVQILQDLGVRSVRVAAPDSPAVDRP